jgi:hypothetical protein
MINKTDSTVLNYVALPPLLAMTVMAAYVTGLAGDTKGLRSDLMFAPGWMKPALSEAARSKR